jgi:hypothetical protein
MAAAISDEANDLSRLGDEPIADASRAGDDFATRGPSKLVPRR